MKNINTRGIAAIALLNATFGFLNNVSAAGPILGKMTYGPDQVGVSIGNLNGLPAGSFIVAAPESPLSKAALQKKQMALLDGILNFRVANSAYAFVNLGKIDAKTGDRILTYSANKFSSNRIEAPAVTPALTSIPSHGWAGAPAGHFSLKPPVGSLLVMQLPQDSAREGRVFADMGQALAPGITAIDTGAVLTGTGTDIYTGEPTSTDTSVYTGDPTSTDTSVYTGGGVVTTDTGIYTGGDVSTGVYTGEEPSTGVYTGEDPNPTPSVTPSPSPSPSPSPTPVDPCAGLTGHQATCCAINQGLVPGDLCQSCAHPISGDSNVCWCINPAKQDPRCQAQVAPGSLGALSK